MSVPSIREPVNAITHFAGTLVSIAGLVLLIVFSSLKADAWHIVSFTIFGASLVMMYSSSTLYHALKLSEKGTIWMRRIDHIMIFIVIAGTYTPLCLVPLRGAWGWTIFGIVWAMAVIGMILKIFSMNIPRWISTGIYLVMGWMCIVAVYPLVMTLSMTCLMWLALGGLFYTAGAVIYAVKKPDPWPKVFGFHEIWHLFVLAGSFCHFWVVFRFLMYI